jgi:phosphatidylserine decarboxylase
MPETIKEFLNRDDIQDIRDQCVGEQLSSSFFRDPNRPIYSDPNVILAWADGIVLYAYKSIRYNDFLDIKGVDLSVAQLLDDDEYKEESLVIGIFMTSLDVHINRVPLSSHYLCEKNTNFLYTHNISMLLVENEIFEHLHYNKCDLHYLKSNERKVSTFYCSDHKLKYYLVQIGEKDIDVILNWGKGSYLHQGDRFGQIRFGSQVDLVIPLTKVMRTFKILVKPLMHVEAGVDAIVEIV